MLRHRIRTLKSSGNVITAVILAAVGIVVIALLAVEAPAGAVWATLVAGVLLAASPRQIEQWDRGILLRLGRFRRILKPGISWVVPGVDRIAANVDMRIRSTSFSAEKTLTRDTVPVDVDAVLFWVVTDAQRAVLEVEEFESTVSWAAQTALRDVIGKSELARMISDRQALDDELQIIIDAKTTEWGVTVQSVEIRDVRIPAELEDAMSRKAQADREREARVILAGSELLVAEQMDLASKIYLDNPTALRLRAMNMTYESIKERGALMVIPSAMAESMDPGVLGLAAVAGKVPPEPRKARKDKSSP
jgi:regulator of protease activity HflC (stomatin/prohibitin superfamily)